VVSAAVAAAVIAVGAPASVGATSPEPAEHAGPVAVADPVQGGWVRFAGPQGLQLARISEDGEVWPIGLPPLLQTETNGEFGNVLTPLRSGWLVDVAPFYPGGSSERVECDSRFPPETCGELAVAELSPTGRWTTPQPLPHSRGRDASAAEPVEVSGGRIELAWEEGQPGIPTISVADGRLGARLSRPRRSQRLMRSEPEHEGLENYHGVIIVRGEFGEDHTGFPQHAIERRLYGDGRLGRPHSLHGPLISDQGQRFALPDGGETYVFWGGYWGGFAVRPPGSSTYGRKHLFSKDVEVGIQAAENRRGRVLIVLRAWRRSGSQLMAAEVSPRGALEATHVLETGPSEPEGGYGYEGAIEPSGQELVISTDAAHRVWAHAAASRCRRFSRTPLAITGGEYPLLFAGARGTFHLVWEDHATHTIQTAAVEVKCNASGVR
jgi:hypothetical protein